MIRPTAKEFMEHCAKEYCKPSTKLKLEDSGKKGLKKATLSDGRNYSVRTSRKRYFTPSEWNNFWNSLDTDEQRLTFDVLINTGARITEATNIKWSDVNEDKSTITLRVTKIKATKGQTKCEPRTIKISSQFLKRLIVHYDAFHMDENSINLPLGMLSQPYTRKLLKHFCEKSGIKDPWNFSPHNLRKTHGNWLKALGVDGLEICQRLGHDQNTFLKAYGSSDVFSKEEKIEIRKIVGDIYE